VYKNDNAEYFEEALGSIFNQTIKPNEVILVKDGPVTVEIEDKINKFLNAQAGILKVFPLEVNCGLAAALNFGLTHISNELVIRCDSDDVNLPYRFETLIKNFPESNEHAVLGSYMVEFGEGIPNRIRKVPTSHLDCLATVKTRNPINHPSVVFKRSIIKKIGGYSEELRFAQDYELWGRLIANGYRVSNLDIPLVNFRTSTEQMIRRGGWVYVKYDILLMKAFLNSKLLNYTSAIQFLVPRVLGRFIPNSLKRKVYNTLR
jgi:glycosyltransferase involved in cell wall biosynthesis